MIGFRSSLFAVVLSSLTCANNSFIVILDCPLKIELLRSCEHWSGLRLTSINGISEVYHRFAHTLSSKYPAVISPFFQGVYLALHIPSSRRINRSRYFSEKQNVSDVDLLFRYFAYFKYESALNCSLKQIWIRNVIFATRQSCS